MCLAVSSSFVLEHVQIGNTVQTELKGRTIVRRVDSVSSRTNPGVASQLRTLAWIAFFASLFVLIVFVMVDGWDVLGDAFGCAIGSLFVGFLSGTIAGHFFYPLDPDGSWRILLPSCFFGFLGFTYIGHLLNR